MNSFRGHLLVAASHQLDPNFFESVILVVQHNHRGAFGVIVNCPHEHCREVCFNRFGRRMPSAIHVSISRKSSSTSTSLGTFFSTRP